VPITVPLAAVAGRARPMPPDLLELGPAFCDWLRPLLDIPNPWPRTRW
jgi:hypothetical protein